MAKCLRRHDRLPSDIIFTILLGLRVKTLCKFRCVSKSWSILISDPFFIQSHHHRSKQNPLLLTTYYNPRNIEEKVFDSRDKAKNVISQFVKPMSPSFTHMLFTCLDLVCLFNEHNVYICNPATEELILLPEPSRPGSQAHFELVFGYLPSTKEYKVLRLFAESEDHWGCEIFTLGAASESWKRVRNSPVNAVSTSAFSDESAYFLPYQEVQKSNDAVARFDMGKEEWSVITAPISIIDKKPKSVVLSHVEGRLCLVDRGTAGRMRADLWFLKDNHCWEKEYSIDFSSRARVDIWDDGWYAARVSPRAICEDGRILLEVRDYLQELHYYDPKSKSFRQFDTHDISASSFYVESFTSLSKQY